MGTRNIEAQAALDQSSDTRPTIAIFSDRSQMLTEFSEDAIFGGFRIVETGKLGVALDQSEHPYVELLLIDCPTVTDDLSETLERYDEGSFRSWHDIIVSTDIETLDTVFSSFKIANPKILISSGRTERLLAMARVRSEASESRKHRLRQEDRTVFLKMSLEVSEIAEKFDNLIAEGEQKPSAFRLISRAAASGRANEEHASDRLVRRTRPPLPDPQLVRQIIRQRQLRATYFSGELFSDPVWDMLLDLVAARVEHVRVSVTSLCIASGAPPTTALRWISQMNAAGLTQRVEDEGDKRRTFITLTDKAADSMARFFQSLGKESSRLV